MNHKSFRIASTIAAVSLTLVTAGCGSSRQAPPPTPSTVSAWPDAGTYQTLTVALAARNAALREPNWRHKAFGADLALLTLTHPVPRLAPGPCATFAAHLYAELLDLHDAYRGEDWRPMIAIVRRDPPLARVCRAPAFGTRGSLVG